MTTFLDNLIEHPNFKIDTILPNYLIYSKMNPDDVETTYSFNDLLHTIKSKFQLTIKFFIQSIRRDQVTKKLFISQQIQEELEQTQLNEIIKEQLIADLQVFLYGLSQIQDLYTMFFKNDFFNELETQDILDDQVNLNWFNGIIEERIILFLSNMIGTAQGLLYSLILQQLSYYDLIIQINKIIVQIFNDCSKSLQIITSEFIEETNKCNLCNKYLLMALFEELSVRAYDLVENYQDYTIFHLSSQDAKEEFARFVINYFDVMTLYINKNDDDLHTPFQKLALQYVKENENEIEAIEQALCQIETKHTKIITHKIISKYHQKPGLLIEIEREDNKKDRFIIHKPDEKIVITNAKLVQNRWIYIEALENLSPEKLLLKKQESSHEYNSIEQAFNSLNIKNNIGKLQEQEFDQDGERVQFMTFNESTAEIQNAFQDTIKVNNLTGFTTTTGEAVNVHITTAAGDIGASLGACLANINRYNSRKEFLADFGQTAIVSGTFTYIATQMPIIGQLFALGAFGYFTAKIYSNESNSQKGKNTQLNKLVISTTANVSSGIGGALIGQALIPVPIVGALIGGFIGGLLGGASSAMILDYMSEQRFLNLFEQIKFKQENGHWEYSEEYLDSLGLSRQIFDEQMPNNLRFDEQRDDKWITIISFVYSTVYQAQIDNEKYKKQQHSSNNHSFSDSSKNTSEILEQHVDNDEFPAFIEQASKWIISSKCLLGLSIQNIEIIIRSIFQNL